MHWLSRTFIAIGADSGVRFELVTILYTGNGYIYIAAHSAENVGSAMQIIKASAPSSKGQPGLLILYLADYPTIKKAVNKLFDKEGHFITLVQNV